MVSGSWPTAPIHPSTSTTEVCAQRLTVCRVLDPGLCPAALRNSLAVHVAYKAKIIQYALDGFPDEYSQMQASASGWRYYTDDVYKTLCL
jgi:hypothetical protein